MNFFDKFWHEILKRPYKLVRTVDAGKGKPLLLIHGLGTSGFTWNPFIKQANTNKWELIGYDLLGFGKSPKPQNNTYDVAEHSRAILASLGNKYRNKKYVIIGHSMGCLIASHIAWKHPERVERLILYEPPLFADSPEFRSHSRRKKLYFSIYSELLKRPRVLFAYSKFFAKFAEAAIVNIDQQSWTAFERSLKNTIMKQTAYNELKKIQVRTDIIYGKFDFIVTRRDVKDMLQANKNITFHLVNEMHDVTARSSRYIIRLLEDKPAK